MCTVRPCTHSMVRHHAIAGSSHATCAALSTSLSLMAIGTSDGAVVLWDHGSKKPQGAITAHKGSEITYLSFLVLRVSSALA